MERKENDLLENSNLFLTSLSKMDIRDYRQLGFTLHSILRVCQSALLNEQEDVRLHKDLDIYNLLCLAESLIPDPELELLDKLKNNF
ncbi:hypothetical protein ETU10_06980 [Apibacter muscae]|uniref:hypothetical protein n=1 Tax=Apibacter muscae TaxID=2509004 RepID=UPI0011AD5D39|nr:hypothetical protein [Apibacter muscae]TWP23465.1 hypothetical protein ETU10_06980 [Apibacter muscae]